MKTRQKLIIGFLILVAMIIPVVIRFFHVSTMGNINFSTNIKYKWEEKGRDTYKVDCDYENKNKIIFPLESVEYCEIYRGFFKSNIRIDKYRTQIILEILNDSTSYMWGEVGTFYEDWIILYYNSSQRIVGKTRLDLGGYTYSEPWIRKMKWGALTDEGLGRLMREIYPLY